LDKFTVIHSPAWKGVEGVKLIRLLPFNNWIVPVAGPVCFPKTLNVKAVTDAGSRAVLKSAVMMTDLGAFSICLWGEMDVTTGAIENAMFTDVRIMNTDSISFLILLV